MKRVGHVLWLLAFALFWGNGVAFAGVAEEVSRLFELNAQLKPGTTLQAANQLLGPCEEERMMGSKTVPLKRSVWLKGDTGVEIYSVEDTVHKVNVTLRFAGSKDALKTLDAITRRGSQKYGSMPRFDHSSAQYYWVADGVRFGFSKYNTTTILSTCTRIQ